VEVHHVAQLGEEPVGALPVGLVHHEHVGHLQEARLHGLDGVPRLRHQDHHRRVGQARDVQLRLADADRLHQHPVEAEGVVEALDLGRRPREPAQAAAGGHAPDEDARVERVGLHADAIAEDGAPREGAGRVDGGHAHRLAPLAQKGHQAVDQRALPRPGRPGEPDRVGPAGARMDALHDGGHAARPALHQSDQAGEGAAVPAEHLVDQRRVRVRQRGHRQATTPSRRSAASAASS
jgi:hypothetical protein